MNITTVKPPIKDTLKEDNLPTKDNLKFPSIHTPYKITSERGQPPYKGQFKSSLLYTLHTK